MSLLPTLAAAPSLAAGLAFPLEWVIGLGFALFAVGILGVACRRNILIMLLSVEIMLNAANLVLVGFSRVHGELSGQVFVFFAMVVAAAEVAVGLAIVIALFRLRKSTDVDDADELHEIEYGPVAPLKLEGEPSHHHDDHDDHGDHPGDDDGGDDDPKPEATPVGAAGEA